MEGWIEGWMEGWRQTAPLPSSPGALAVPVAPSLALNQQNCPERASALLKRSKPGRSLGQGVVLPLGRGHAGAR